MVDRPKLGRMPVRLLSPEEVAQAQEAIDAERWAVVCPYYSHITPLTDELLVQLEATGARVIRAAAGSDLPRARSVIASTILEEGKTDRLLWLDADQACFWEWAIRLLLSDEPFLTAVAPSRATKMLLVDFTPPGDEPPATLVFGAEGGVIDVYRGGFGTVVTSRAVLQAVADSVPKCRGTGNHGPFWPMFCPYFALVEGSEDTVEYIAEDWAFCMRAREAGFPLRADMRVRVAHHGAKTYEWEHVLIHDDSMRHRTIKVGTQEKPEGEGTSSGSG